MSVFEPNSTGPTIEEPPGGDSFLYEISDTTGVEPREMPWIRASRLDPWLERLRSLR